jgi:hypothetical protein
MPCLCDIVDNDALGHHRMIIKSYVEAIVKEMREIDKLRDLRGISILEETQKLIEHLYTGKCDERKK